MAGLRLEALCNHTDAFRCVFMQLNLHTLGLNESVKKTDEVSCRIINSRDPEVQEYLYFYQVT